MCPRVAKKRSRILQQCFRILSKCFQIHTNCFQIIPQCINIIFNAFKSFEMLKTRHKCVRTLFRMFPTPIKTDSKSFQNASQILSSCLQILQKGFQLLQKCLQILFKHAWTSCPKRSNYLSKWFQILSRMLPNHHKRFQTLQKYFKLHQNAFKSH